jgi:uncharacterized protein (TIGR02246 family)
MMRTSVPQGLSRSCNPWRSASSRDLAITALCLLVGEWYGGVVREPNADRRQGCTMITEDERAIHALIDTWMAATKAGDIMSVLDLMTDDVVFMVPGREPFGKQEFAAMSRSQQGLRIDGKAEICELQVLGLWAFARTFLKIAVHASDTNTVERSGYTLTIFRKVDGRWRLARDVNLLTHGQGR